MFRTVLNAVILPLEVASLHLAPGHESGGEAWWMLAATLATTMPAIVHWADRLFGEQEPETLSVVDAPAW
jgi:hypothetical protein